MFYMFYFQYIYTICLYAGIIFCLPCVETSSRFSILLAMADGRASSSSSGSPVFFLCSRANSSPAKSSSSPSDPHEAPSEDNSSIGSSFLPGTEAALDFSYHSYQC